MEYLTEKVINALFFTVKQAFCSSAFALVIGLPLAFFVAKRKFLGKGVLNFLSSIPYCMPTLLVVLGFVMFYGMNGTLNKFLVGVGTFFGIAKEKIPQFTALYSFWGIVLTHGFFNFPIIMRMCSDAWATIPTNQAEAAKLLGASEWRIFRTITVFQIAPAVASSFMLVFLYCFFSFIIVLMFGSVGCSTMEVEIFQAIRSSFDVPLAIRLTIIETVVALFFVLLFSQIEKKAKRNTGIKSKRVLLKPVTSKCEKICLSILLFVVFLFLIMPLLMIFAKAFSTFSQVFSRKTFWPAVKNTVIVAFFTGFLCTILGSCYALFVHKIDRKKQNHILRTILPMIPMAVSPIAIGLFLILLIGKGSVFSLVIVQSLLTWPFAYRQIIASLNRLPLSLEESLSLLSFKRIDKFRRFYFPLCYRSFICAFAFSFAISAGDASLPLVLAIPKFDNLSLFIYRLAGSYRFDQACAAGCVLALLTAGVYFVATYFQKEKKC